MKKNSESGEGGEDQERFKQAELRVELPDGIQNNFKISFESESFGICAAYNRAILEIAERKKLNPFHQSGVSPRGEDGPGYHKWEFWKETNEDKLPVLFEEIHALAEQKFQLHRELGLHEVWREKYGS